MLPEAPLTIAGSGQAPGLSIFPSGGNYNEGIRIHPSSGNGYSVLMLGAVSGVSGTGTGQWGIIDYPSSSSYMFGLRYSGNADALNILTNGSVGIGGTNSSYNLYLVGSMYATGIITAASDQRLKQNIKPLTGTLSKLDQLRGVSFEWNRLAVPLKHKEGEKGIGMIAQELQKVYPQLVTGSKKDYLGINYGAFTAVLLQAIKEQQKEIEELQKKLGMDK